MKQIQYILLPMLMLSCTIQKNTSNSNYDADVDQQAFIEARNKFFVSDSALAVIKNLGWAGRILKDAKIQENTIPVIFQSINNGEGFTIKMPCWEFDTPEYYVSTVIVEHTNLDSALVKAKSQGVDDIFLRSKQRIKGGSDTISLKNDSINPIFHIEEVSYLEDYANYISNARFSCICITKTKKKYIVNATITVPNPGYLNKLEEFKRAF